MPSDPPRGSDDFAMAAPIANSSRWMPRAAAWYPGPVRAPEHVSQRASIFAARRTSYIMTGGPTRAPWHPHAITIR